MQDIIIRSVEKRDLTLLDEALRALSKELNDPYPSSIEFLEQAGFGQTPTYYALIALDTEGSLCGTVVFSPVMSVTLASSGLYVSDLWVANKARGCGVGRRLLAEAANVAYAKWGGNYIKLAVYDESTNSRRFYERLGLTERGGETIMFLDPSRVGALRG
ncbi:MAG: N-acetyltransferase family protein [Granulosicoccus sp.]